MKKLFNTLLAASLLLNAFIFIGCKVEANSEETFNEGKGKYYRIGNIQDGEGFIYKFNDNYYDCIFHTRFNNPCFVVTRINTIYSDEEKEQIESITPLIPEAKSGVYTDGSSSDEYNYNYIIKYNGTEYPIIVDNE